MNILDPRYRRLIPILFLSIAVPGQECGARTGEDPAGLMYPICDVRSIF